VDIDVLHKCQLDANVLRLGPQRGARGDLLGRAATGKVQLPDFQREWKWDDDRIASLLASISLGYPVGGCHDSGNGR